MPLADAGTPLVVGFRQVVHRDQNIGIGGIELDGQIEFAPGARDIFLGQELLGSIKMEPRGNRIGRRQFFVILAKSSVELSRVAFALHGFDDRLKRVGRIFMAFVVEEETRKINTGWNRFRRISRLPIDRATILTHGPIQLAMFL